MQLLEPIGRALGHEWRTTLGTLRDRRLALALTILGALLALAAWAPLNYRVAMGVEDGPGSDLPLIRGFFPPERSAVGPFRWTTGRAQVRLPGIGQRPVVLEIEVLPVNAEVARRGPQRIALWHGGSVLATLPLLPTGGQYSVRLPSPPSGNGDQSFELRSATFVPTGDERAIGIPVQAVVVAARAGPALPAWPTLAGWLLAAALLWLGVRRAGFGPRAAFGGLLALALLLGLAAVLDPPRTAFGAWPAAEALALAWLLLVALGHAAPPLARRFAVPLDARALRWLLLLALLVFALQFGGKIYPDSMPGDIGFHANRMADVIRGRVLLLSRNRGVDFPYPPALYLLVAPFMLLPADPRRLLQLAAALLAALSPLLVYAIAAVAGRPAFSQGSASERGEYLNPSLRTTSWAIVAAGIYALSPSGFMTNWWNFSTHIFAQFACLVLIAALIVGWPRLNGARAHGRHHPVIVSSRPYVITFALLQSFVYLGHFGFWINMSLLGTFGLAALLLAAWRGRVPWPAFWRLLAAFAGAEGFAGLFFYSGYTQLFAEQVRAAASGGLTGLAGREPAPFDILWNTLWDAGVRVHFGLFAVLLAAAGLVAALAAPRGAGARAPLNRRSVALALMSGTFLVALGFAVLPFLTRSTLSTRWLMFSAWAVSVAGAWGARRVWRAGRAGRLAVALMGGYLLWLTAVQWLAALAWRVRPPEPF
jgi:hypothetical protein